MMDDGSRKGERGKGGVIARFGKGRAGRIMGVPGLGRRRSGVLCTHSIMTCSVCFSVSITVV